MQISRHWRIKAQRYRLEGIRHENGEISLSNRPANTDSIRKREETREEVRVRVTVNAR
jgi:hypothetical protein